MLEELFRPDSLAVVGATDEPGKIGRVVMENIIDSEYPGTVYPVNPSRDEVLSMACYPSVADLPRVPELAVIIVPAGAALEVMEECASAGVKVAVVISAGFKEAGREGYLREKSLGEIARSSGVRVLGPNCLGFADTHTPLNATFAARAPLKGRVAFISQSGALYSAVLGWSVDRGLGFSRFVSLGNKIDLDENDLMEALDGDKNTSVITLYLEGVSDGERFLEVASRVSRRKPVVVYKAGVTQAGARAVSSHTGTLAGSENAYKAAFNKSGVTRASTLENLFMNAMVFAQQDLPGGPNVAIVTDAGGPGIVASDALEGYGFMLASLGEKTIAGLREGLPEAANIYNPVDILGDAGPERYGLAVSRVLEDPAVDALLVILTAQATTNASEVAVTVSKGCQNAEKTVLAVFMGGSEMDEAEETLRNAGIPNFRFPEEAATTLHSMYSYKEYLDRPRRNYASFEVSKERVERIFDDAREGERNQLVEVEARQVLEAYGIQTARTRLATNLEECIKFGREIGYPVVLKVSSPQIMHKTDIGAVVVDIADTDELVTAYERITANVRRLAPDAEVWGVLVQEMLPSSREIIIGMNKDSQFGPLLMVGLGGIYVEFLEDVSFRLAPVSEEEAGEMLKELKSYRLLRGARGEQPADFTALEEAILRISQLVCDYPCIEELDINPLKVFETGKGCLAADARIVLEE